MSFCCPLFVEIDATDDTSVLPRVYTVTLCSRMRGTIDNVRLRIEADDKTVLLGPCCFLTDNVADVCKTKAKNVLRFDLEGPILAEEQVEVQFICALCLPDTIRCTKLRAYIENFRTQCLPASTCAAKSRKQPPISVPTTCCLPIVSEPICLTTSTILASLHGIVFVDTNATGTYVAGQDTPLACVVVVLDGIDCNGERVAQQTVVSSAATGEFEFVDLLPGTYTLRTLEDEFGKMFRCMTTADTVEVTLDAGQEKVFARGMAGPLKPGQSEVVDERLSFGFAFYGSMHGVLFQDCNKNDEIDQREASKRVQNVAVLLQRDGSTAETANTNINGEFWFKCLKPATYTVQVDHDASPYFVPQGADSFTAEIQSGQEFVAYSGQAGLNLPKDPRIEIQSNGLRFGLTPASSLHGLVFYDADGDDLYDGSALPATTGCPSVLVDQLLRNVSLDLFKQNEQGEFVQLPESTTVTDQNGLFAMHNLCEGRYLIVPSADETACSIPERKFVQSATIAYNGEPLPQPAVPYPSELAVDALSLYIAEAIAVDVTFANGEQRPDTLQWMIEAPRPCTVEAQEESLVDRKRRMVLLSGGTTWNGVVGETGGPPAGEYSDNLQDLRYLSADGTWKLWVFDSAIDGNASSDVIVIEWCLRLQLTPCFDVGCGCALVALEGQSGVPDGIDDPRKEVQSGALKLPVRRLGTISGCCFIDANGNGVFECLDFVSGPLVQLVGGTTSTLQSSLGMTVYGFSNQVNFGYWVADDFEVPASGWPIKTIDFFAYQIGSSTTSTINEIRVAIYQSDASFSKGPLVFGDLTTNRLHATEFTGIYRDDDVFVPGSTARPIMRQTVLVNQVFPPGIYRMEWQTGGTLASGPWAPPITITGQTTTGNGEQSLDGAQTFFPALDFGTDTQQGFPFVIRCNSDAKEHDEPLPNHRVTLSGVDGYGNVVSRTAVSDAEGKFVFRGLQPSVLQQGFGTGYTLRCSSPDYITTVPLEPLDLFGGQSLVQDVGCTQPGSLHGIVCLDDGQRLGGAKVTLTGQPNLPGSPPIDPQIVETVVNSGQFWFDNLLPGNYNVQVDAPPDSDFAPATTARTFIVFSGIALVAEAGQSGGGDNECVDTMLKFSFCPSIEICGVVPAAQFVDRATDLCGNDCQSCSCNCQSIVDCNNTQQGDCGSSDDCVVCACDFRDYSADDSFAVVYVAADAAAPGDGTSWATAYANLQTALTNAPSAAEVWIKQGTYVGGFTLSKQLRLYGGFVGTEASRDARSTNPALTVFDGQNSMRVMEISPSTASVLLDCITVTQGRVDMMMRGGGLKLNDLVTATFRNVRFLNNFADFGGGMCVSDSAYVDICNCLFQENASLPDQQGGGGILMDGQNSIANIYSTVFNENRAGAGAAIAATNSAIVNVDGSSFTGNVASQNGGAIAARLDAMLRVCNCTFEGNLATRENADLGIGGAINVSGAQSIILCSTFVDNAAKVSGGAIAVLANSTATVCHCSFENNQTTKEFAFNGSGGGAVAVAFSTTKLCFVDFNNNLSASFGGAVLVVAGTANICNAVFSDNVSPEGGAVYAGQNTQGTAQSALVNVCNGLFTKNQAQGGGAIQVDEGATCNVYSSTFYQNVATPNPFGGGGAFLCKNLSTTNIYNSILWQNTSTFGPEISSPSTSTTLTNAIISVGGILGTVTQTNVINDDPQFIDEMNGNFRLRWMSPAINAGDNNLFTQPFSVSGDLDAFARIVDGTTDLGAYEFQDIDIGTPARTVVLTGKDCTGADVSVTESVSNGLYVFANVPQPQDGTEYTVTLQTEPIQPVGDCEFVVVTSASVPPADEQMKATVKIPLGPVLKQ